MFAGLEAGREVGEEVGGHEAAAAAQLAHEEAVVVHVSEDDEDLAGPEGELHLAVHVGAQLGGVVVVQRDLPPAMTVIVNFCALCFS